MSSISAINGGSYDYSYIASGKRLQSASDGASELAIANKQNLQASGLDQGSKNVSQAQSMLNVSDGALGSITDYLQRIRELAVNAADTATVSDADRQAIQSEIDSLKQGIGDVASQTTFNTKNILDGSQGEMNVATDSNGSAVSLSTTNSTLEALGIADFDVTGEFDIGAIDEAIANLSSQRSQVGAQSNALDYIQLYNSNASYNTTVSSSKLEDLDIPEAVSEKKKQEALQSYSLMMQKRKEEDEQNSINRLFSGF
mgnify:CR=1 FL=1